MNFTKNFTDDFYHCGKLDLPWETIRRDLETIKTDQERNIPAVNNPFVKDTPLAELHNEYLQYGYTEHNTKIWKTTNSKDKLTFNWESDIIKQLPLDHAIATVTRQDPGQVLPWHIDRFFLLKKYHPNDNRPIWRFLLFLEDWKIGHLLQVNNSICYHWKQGEVIVWHPGTEHLAANVGLETKWTCNITGFLTV